MKGPDYWNRVEVLLHEAMNLSAADRAPFLQQIEEADIRAEVSSLVEADSCPSDLAVEDTIRQSIGEAAAGFSLSGRSIGKYQVLERAGAGGMSEVYLARDPRLDRKTALKVLPPGFSENKDRVRRLEQEARIISSLNHPNIVTIYEVGEDSGRLYIAMEFVSGESLQSRVAKGPLATADAIVICEQIAAALGAAHGAGVAHRDIKPSNVMVRPDGLVKVLDFGLAQTTGPQAPGSAPESLEGLVVGTPAYMSPEQARGKKAGPASDLWSLGAVFYELLTGVPPFAGHDAMDVLVAVLGKEPVQPASIRPGIPAAVEELTLRLLSKDPATRPHDASRVMEQLRGLLGVEATSASHGRRSVMIFAAAGCLALATGGVALYSRRSGDAQLPLWTCSLTEDRAGTLVSVSPQESLRNSSRIRANVSVPKSGFVYLLGETLAGREKAQYTALFPTPSVNGGTAWVERNQVVHTGWFRFDDQVGTERIWFVWGAVAIPELEALGSVLNHKDQGIVREAGTQRAITHVLQRPDLRARAVNSSPTSARLEWTGTSSPLVAMFEVQHR